MLSTSTSYVTGSHAFKTGVQWTFGSFLQTRDANADLVQEGPELEHLVERAVDTVVVDENEVPLQSRAIENPPRPIVEVRHVLELVECRHDDIEFHARAAFRSNDSTNRRALARRRRAPIDRTNRPNRLVKSAVVRV